MPYLRIVTVSKADTKFCPIWFGNEAIILYFTGTKDHLHEGRLLDKVGVKKSVIKKLEGDIPKSLEELAESICELFDICFKVDIQESDGSVVSYEWSEDEEG